MGDVSENFSLWESECPCGCGFKNENIPLNEIKERVRKHFNKPFIIKKSAYDKTMHCQCRCWSHNKSVGGSEKSKHLFGMAVDFHVEGVDNETVYEYVNSIMPNWGGLIIYDWGLHMDVRDEYYRDDKRSKI